MAPQTTQREQTTQDATVCAELDAAASRVSRTEAAEGGTSAEIGGLVRLFFQKPNALT